MLNQHTLATLRHLKLTGMADAFEEQMLQPAAQALSFEERLGLLVNRELTSRDNRRLKRLLKGARMRYGICVEDIGYRVGRGLDREYMMSLTTCQWIRNQQNLVLTEATVCGKSWLACSLGNQACRQRMSVVYARMPRLLEVMRLKHADCSYGKKMAQLAKTDLLILDEWGLALVGQHERNDLLEIIDDRPHRQRSSPASCRLKSGTSIWGSRPWRTPFSTGCYITLTRSSCRANR